MITDLQVDPSSIHCIGHSLGAHLCGHTGRNIALYGNIGKIARITGLDPAGPGFNLYTDYLKRINKNDATLVDIIHTNAGSLAFGYQGLTFNEGHIDFWANGGSTQPQCPKNSYIDYVQGCSHDAGIDYYIESIAN